MRIFLQFLDLLTSMKENTEFWLFALKYKSDGSRHQGHIRDVRPEWVSSPGQKPADGCKVLNKNLRMDHNFAIILPGNG